MKKLTILLFAFTVLATVARGQSKNSFKNGEPYNQIRDPKTISLNTGIAQPAKVDTTVHVSLPVLQSFIKTVYTIGLNDAQRTRLNMALNDLQKRATLTVDSLRKDGKKL